MVLHLQRNRRRQSFAPQLSPDRVASSVSVRHSVSVRSGHWCGQFECRSCPVCILKCLSICSRPELIHLVRGNWGSTPVVDAATVSQMISICPRRNKWMGNGRVTRGRRQRSGLSFCVDTKERAVSSSCGICWQWSLVVVVQAPSTRMSCQCLSIVIAGGERGSGDLRSRTRWQSEYGVVAEWTSFMGSCLMDGRG